MCLIVKILILCSNAKVYAMQSFHQIHLYDINENMLEVNQVF
jgi:hypothetical protein